MSWKVGFNSGDSTFRLRATGRLLDRLMKGEEKGRAKYGEDFLGDPLEHAFEEACDLAFYLATELERRGLGAN